MHANGTPKPPLHGARLSAVALASYPEQAAATRFRLTQLLPHLAAAGIDVTFRPFLDAPTFTELYDRGARTRTAIRLLGATASRVADVARARAADVVLVLREAMLAGPPVIETLACSVGRCPLVLDLDDATWVPYESPTHGLLAGLLKPPGKTFRLIDRATCVTCGSPYVAAEVAARGGTAVLLPPAVETTTFRPAADRPAADLPVVGWIGTHSTYPYLEAVLPALRAVARTHPIRLRVVGSGRPAPDLPGIDLDWRDWSLEREPDDFASLDVGLYPLPAGDAWAAGKAGLKSVQYLACGVPFVASPVRGAKSIEVPGRHTSPRRRPTSGRRLWRS